MLSEKKTTKGISSPITVQITLITPLQFTALDKLLADLLADGSYPTNDNWL